MEEKKSLLLVNNLYSEFCYRLFNVKREGEGVILRTKSNYTTPLMRLITCIRFMESCVRVTDSAFISCEDYNKYPIQIYIYNPYSNNSIIHYNNEFIGCIEFMLMNGMKINISFNDNTNFTYPEWGVKLKNIYPNCEFQHSNHFDIDYCKGLETFRVGIYDIDKKSSIIISHKSKGQIIVADSFIAYNHKPMIDPIYFL